jgi:hypothetical protein
MGSQRIHRRLAIVDNEVPDFQDVQNCIYLSDNLTKGGSLIYLEGGVLTVRTGSKTSSLPSVGEYGIFFGEEAGENLESGSDNILFGKGSGKHLRSTSNVIAIGTNTLNNNSSIGDSIAIGTNSMGECGETELNIALGRESLMMINDSYNIGIGIEAGKEMKGPLVNHNICFGRASMKSAGASSIGLISIGSFSAEKIQGNNFRSIYIGEKCAQNLSSKLISENNIGLGSYALISAKDVNDTICIGLHSGNNISGNRSIILGCYAASNVSGMLSEDLIGGCYAGASRAYTPDQSRCIFFGKSAGQTGSGIELIGVGTNALGNSHGSFDIAVGHHAGEHQLGNSNVSLGKFAGESSQGDHNIFAGEKAGAGVIGSRNVWMGRMNQLGDVLNDSVILGDDVFVKGQKSIVIGAGAGKFSIGSVSRDILFGYQAGQGQKYEESSNIFFGSAAGMGDIHNPENVSSKNVIAIGHDSGRSDEQNFSNCLFFGNCAGSFSTVLKDTLVFGHNAGIGISGEKNIYIGHECGANIKGSGNVFLGPKIGESSLNEQISGKLIIGNEKGAAVYSDITRGNLLLGVRNKYLEGWTDGEGTLGFMDREVPKSVSKDVSGVLYSTEGHLGFASSEKGKQLLTFPYKILRTGELNGLTLEVRLFSSGSSVLNVKLIPNHPGRITEGYFFHSEILLNVHNGKATVYHAPDSKWTVKTRDNKLTFECGTEVDGLAYIEVIGEQIVV